jgi:hypothetical protein
MDSNRLLYIAGFAWIIQQQCKPAWSKSIPVGAPASANRWFRREHSVRMGNIRIAGVVRVADSNNRYTVQQETLAQNGVTRYQLFYDATPLSYSDAVAHWQHDAEFRSYFVGLLQQSRYQAFRWETPAYSARLSTRPFEFVLVDNPSFATRKTDARTYREYFTSGDNSNHGIVTFPNLSGDCLLIVPSPTTTLDVYGHLAAFVRQAPAAQIDSLWQIVGKAMAERTDTKTTWLSTAGGGVAWLHVRLDNSPKYYAYAPYRRSASG